MTKLSDTDGSGKSQSKKYLAGLTLAAIGIVYGDIGTSVLYAFRESFHPGYGLSASPANVLGILSLIFWTLILVITVKYITFVLRADNDGEGGIVALTALISPKKNSNRTRYWLVLAGLFGAALLFGDGMITPAISVLSAIEGLKVATPIFQPYIIPITVVILIGLFSIQKFGSAGLGKIFGVVTITWFLTLAALGINQILQVPEVFAAVNPVYAVEFFMRNGLTGYWVLGSVFLVCTGGEALYADIGHFGVLPIRITWYAIVLPAIVLNYFGQGALLLNNPAAAHNPFFLMAPEWALYPLVILATAATCIASQAVISGTFSLMRQAAQLGYLPRLNIEQTSSKEVGQVYIPSINWILMIASIGLVIGFGSSSALAAAYGVGVSTDFVITTILFAVVMRSIWKWSWPVVLSLTGVFLIVDLAFFGANIVKVPEGGWFPLVVAGSLLLIMTTWKKGRDILKKRIRAGELPLEKFMQDVESYADVEEQKIQRCEGTAVYMYSNPKGTPPALLHNIKHNKVIHKDVVLLSVKTTYDHPYVSKKEQIEIESIGSGFYKIILHHGFAQSINIPNAFKRIDEPGLDLDIQTTSFFLGSERIIASEKKYSGMAKWRDHLFGFMVRNQQRATAYFGLPTNRVIEMGAEMKL